VRIIESGDFMAAGRSAGVAALGITIAGLLVGCGSSRSSDTSADIAALQSELARIEAEVDRVADASAIKRLQRAYGYYVDQGLWDEAADLFTADGTIELGLDGVYVGRDRIRQYLYKLGDGRRGLAQGELNEHLQVQPAISVSADGMTAKARWRAVLMTGRLGKSAAWGEGPYEVQYAKQDGVWKIASLHWYHTFLVPYEGGWAKNKDLTGGVYVSKEFPPDRPPTETYDVWPGVYVPPFHYGAPAARESMAAASPATAAGPASSALDQIARRAQLLRDTDEIEKLVSMYGYYLDKQQWDALTELFAEDSSMEISQRGVYFGKKGVRRALELFGPQNILPNHLHNHIQLQPVIHVSPDGQRASIRSRALSQLGTFGAIGVWGDGVYENEVVKENGVWKIHTDHVYTTFFAPYDPGWGFGARATPKASPKIPPDAPPTEVYESLPEIYVPPFHAMPAADEGAGTPEVALADLPEALREDAARILRKIERLEDEDAIENLQRLYGFYIDKAMWKEAADLFAEDATLEMGGEGVYAGKARILEYLTRKAPEGLTRGRLMNYLQLQPIVHVAPDGLTAKGRWRFLAELGEDQKSATWGGGIYENEYVKENGTWKIRSLHGFVRFFTPYEDGWGKTALPLGKPAADFPPDRPATVRYEPYPAPFVAPFHYKHPVTGK